MGNTESRKSVGTIDGLALSETTTLSQGDVVIAALSPRMRILIAGVVLANLTLGAWLMDRSDFSALKPQGDADRTARSDEADPAPRLFLATANDRD